MRLHINDYRNMVLGCWLGKNIGGTLGAPMEWKRQFNDVTFYTQDLGGEPLPNDDLDIQLLWLMALEGQGVELTAQTLADYWCLYVTPHWAEYGTGKINMRSGLLPPLSGTVGNDFKDSCGSFIRSEIWACIAPGRPDIAARYAYEDAILDHGDGEGTYAEVLVAAMESAAFVVKDLRKLIEIGLTYVPDDCAVAAATKTAVECYDKKMAWTDARDEILRRYRGGTFMSLFDHTSPRDRELGFDQGKIGYDVPSNIGMLILGLLYGEGDFAKTLCTTVNCGEDTDCTAATAGSIFGILYGADAIPEEWITPIGRGIKTIVLDLGDLWGIPQNVDDLTERTVKMARQVLLRYGGYELLSDQPTDLADVNPDQYKSSIAPADRFAHIGGPRFDFPFFQISVDYGADGPFIRDGEPKTVRVKIENTRGIQANLSLHWYLPEGWSVSPSADGYALSLSRFIGGKTLVLEYTFTAERISRAANRAAFEVTAEGRPTVMLVPLTLMNGNVMSQG